MYSISKILKKRMTNSKSVEHKGRIDSINGNRIKVSFLAMSACVSCYAKGVCNASDMKEKMVEVIDFTNQYQVGDEVNVILKQSLGFRALFLGYLLPFILVFFILIILTQLTTNEAISGLGSLSVLIPYYFILYLSKDKIRKRFTFKIAKI